MVTSPPFLYTRLAGGTAAHRNDRDDIAVEGQGPRGTRRPNIGRPELLSQALAPEVAALGAIVVHEVDHQERLDRSG